MAVEEELKALENTREAWRRIAFGAKQGIRRPQAPSLKAGAQEEKGEQTEETPD